VVHFGSSQPSSHGTLSTSPHQAVSIGFRPAGTPSNELATLTPRDMVRGDFTDFRGHPRRNGRPDSLSPLLRRHSPGCPHPGRERCRCSDHRRALKSQVSETDAKRIVTMAKFRAASEADSRDGVISLFGNKVFSEADASVETTSSRFDAVSSSTISHRQSKL